MAAFWPIISSDILNKWFNILVKQLAFDASSSKVRMAVVKGMKLLLTTCPRSHYVLQKALPRISDCLHDINEQVRVAFLDLLLQVKKVRTIRYFDVVPVDHLLARLEIERPNLCKKIVKLLFNSFFPLDENNQVQLERCISLVETNRNASRKLYEYGVESMPLHNAIWFMLTVLVNVKRFVSAEMAQKMSSSSDSSEIESQDDERNKENDENSQRRSKSKGLKNSNQLNSSVTRKPLESITNSSIASDVTVSVF